MTRWMNRDDLLTSGATSAAYVRGRLLRGKGTPSSLRVHQEGTEL